jgi:lipid-A-disaccharide synthase
MMVIFPFEEAFYRARGVKAEFVGHPLAEAVLVKGSREAYAERNELDPAKRWIALLPGSRRKEVAANLFPMLQGAIALSGQNGAADRYEYVLPVASTVNKAWVEGEIESWVRRRKHFGGRPLPRLALVEDAREAMTHARASVVASGTATVLAAVVGNPFIVVYHVSGLTFRVAKRLVRYPPEIPAEVDAAGNLPIGMVNLLAGRRVVPELINERFTGETVAAELGPLLEDGPERQAQIEALAEVRGKLLPASSGDGGVPATGIDRVVAAVLELLGKSEIGPGTSKLMSAGGSLPQGI